jgi:acyl-CoA thioesterase I
MQISNRTLRCLSFALAAGIFMTGCGSDSDFENDDKGFQYVAIGASDAVGVGADPLDNGYVFLIEDALEAGGRDVELVNLGIPGADSDAMEDVQLPLALEVESELITIWAGPNDVVSGEDPESFRGNLRRIVSTLREETMAQIVLGDIPDLTQVPKFQTDPDPDVTRERIASFNQVIRDVAGEFGASVAPLSSIESGAQEFTDDDGFHPSNAGHRRIADLFLSVIRIP